ncbi:putative 4-hydroxy-4-methyl-2-oxoglutarate aldolase 3 isoform X2 [Phaseolus vulgaris]|uniref:putative 4-hydroxy-4-methyl-2-oxoglutarate aldolase 3 isoform X2 n=1 Tax=Phaseolus vulgaris TaxID=3885 RepID=UPI0035CBA387
MSVFGLVCRTNFPRKSFIPECFFLSRALFIIPYLFFTSPIPSFSLGVRNMATLPTAELTDANTTHVANGDLRVLHPVFKVYGQVTSFSGPIVTVKVFEDNVLVRELLETKGEGRVLVVDGGGSLRCALIGGNLAQIAHSMGWAGIVVNGCVRDVDEINACGIGVRALASNPLKSNKKRTGEKNVPVYVGGTFIREGEWLYADNDGILVSKFELSN